MSELAPASHLAARGGGQAANDPAPGAELSVWTELADWVSLLKPRVVALVVFTGLVGLLVAPGHLNPLLAAIATLCIAAGAGAAGAINMWYDRDIDAIMRRTARRPVPAGRISAEAALCFGVVLAIVSVLLMLAATNVLAAVLLAISIGFYVFIYTIWLKRRTPQNIVIGGAAGAFPPMIGWAAVTGQVSIASLALFALIFFWTPPHFWALSLYRAGDYARAGVPMLPVVAGKAETKKQMLLYTLVLWPVAVAPALLHATGWLYGVAALILSALFTLCALAVWRDAGDRAARRMFGFSLLYLFLLFALMAIDRAPGLLAAPGFGA